jgi:flagellar biosynthetic protein FlhB
MAENQEGQEKTEDPTEERREEFRKQGDIAHSKEVTSLFVFFSILILLSFAGAKGFEIIKKIMSQHFNALQYFRISPTNTIKYFTNVWLSTGELILLPFGIAGGIAIFITLLQTRFNVSFERVMPSFSKLNPLTGIKRLFSLSVIIELIKGIGKLVSISILTYLVLYGEWKHIPSFLNLSLTESASYWVKLTTTLFWSTASLLGLIAGVDYIYTFFSIEKKMKMSKQELKEDYKKRESDPIVKQRLRRMQREIANRRTMISTRKATVLITNPTHYAIAIRYELGMRAPILVAKGADLIALEMRKLATSLNIPIIENKPLAQLLYKNLKVDHEVPESLYEALSEVIRYVFKIKGIKLS